MTEKDLVIQFAELRGALDRVKKDEKELNEQMADVKLKISELMESQDKTRTASYEGYGFVGVEKPKVKASYSKEHEQAVFAALEKMGRGDLIKPTIHNSSLVAFVAEQLELNKPLPEGISYFLAPQVKFYKR